MFRSTMFLRFCLAATLLVRAFGQQACVTPTGIGGSNGVNFASLNLPDPQFGFFGVGYHVVTNANGALASRSAHSIAIVPSF